MYLYDTFICFFEYCLTFGYNIVYSKRKIHCGLSTVLFSFQIILNLLILAPRNATVYMYGFRTSAKWAHWIELLLHQYLMPGEGSSFFGRLSGILSGYLYVYLWNDVRWREILDGQWIERVVASMRRRWRMVRDGVRGGGGGGLLSWPSRWWSRGSQVRWSGGGGGDASNSSGESPNVEELRRRRLLRFQWKQETMWWFNILVHVVRKIRVCVHSNEWISKNNKIRKFTYVTYVYTRYTYIHVYSSSRR